MLDGLTDSVQSWQLAATENFNATCRHYRAVAESNKIIKVLPHSIANYCRYHINTKHRKGSKLFDLGTVLDGDWDEVWAGKVNPLLSSLVVVKAVEQRVKYGVPWEETGIYDFKLKQITRSRKGVIDGCKNLQDLRDRYKRLDLVFADIAAHGYRLQMGKHGPDFVNNIGVSVGRSGQFLLAYGGLHRLALLRALNADAFPVYVVTRHTTWQEHRDRILLEGGDRSHPDLADIITKTCEVRGMTTSTSSDGAYAEDIAQKAKIVERIASLTAKQNWMHAIPLPYGLVTAGEGSGGIATWDSPSVRVQKFTKLARRGAKEGLFPQLDLGSARVLDVACGEGKYSFILSPDVREVVAIDIDDMRIEKARYVNGLLKCANVEFKVLNLYSPEFQSLTRFDLALCFGLIHRLPDPFNLINSLASQADAVLFEWITAPGLLSQDVPWAFHHQGKLYEWFNATSNFEDRLEAAKSRAGGGANRAAYWTMSYGALETMCHRAGLSHFLRFSRAPNYPDLSGDLNSLTKRVMLLASRNPTVVDGRETRFGLRKWRTATSTT